MYSYHTSKTSFKQKIHELAEKDCHLTRFKAKELKYVVQERIRATLEKTMDKVKAL